MHKAFFIIFFSFVVLLCSLSCLKNDINLIDNTKIASLVLGRDIHFSDDTNIDLSYSKIYKNGTNYYYGNFYYGDKDRVYYIDYPLLSLNEISGGGIKNIVSNHKSFSNANIMNVDSGGIYITHANVWIKEENVTNAYTTYQDGPDTYEAGASTVYKIETNYVEMKTVGLLKISREGNTLLQINSILDSNDDLLKIVYSEKNFFVIRRKDKIYMDAYDMSGNMINSYSFSELEKSDDKTGEYSSIIDIVYSDLKNVILILVENAEKGKIKNRKVYAYDKDIKEIYTYEQKTEQILGMKSDGTIVSIGFDGKKYFIINENIFTLGRGFSYIENGGEKNMISLSVFQNSVYAFKIDGNLLTFVKY